MRQTRVIIGRKRLFRNQSGKSGRPSHNYHSFFIGKARIALGVDVRPGKQHFGRCGMKRLWALIDALPPNLWPALLRGDVGYGNDATMCEAGTEAGREVVVTRQNPRQNRAKLTNLG